MNTPRIERLHRAALSEQETLAILSGLTVGDIQAAYTDFQNNFLTVQVYAETHGLTEAYTHLLLATGRGIERTGGAALSAADAARLRGHDATFPAYHLY